MSNNTRRFGAIVGIALALIMPIGTAFADSLEQLSAESWQWALAIPTFVNPMYTPLRQAVRPQKPQTGRVVSFYLWPVVYVTLRLGDCLEDFLILLPQC